MSGSQRDDLPRLALTSGEPAGIGPDIILQIAQQDWPAQLVVFADPDLLARRAEQLGLPIQLRVADTHPLHRHKSGQLPVVPIPLVAPVECGRLNPANAPYVLETLRQACQACLAKRFDALVTAPVHKSVINEAGISFRGHTEFLVTQTQATHAVMLLVREQLRVALVTTHLPLTQVSAAITPAKLIDILTTLHRELPEKLGLPNPHILVCGLNPHAGEGGHLGQEEITTIIPVLNDLRSQGLRLTGPVPADSAFTAESLAGIDAVVTMYHDQGLPVLKQLGFAKVVNVTLGLPIIRTSVGHGTALTLAGSGRASSDSLACALKIALAMIQQQ